MLLAACEEQPAPTPTAEAPASPTAARPPLPPALRGELADTESTLVLQPVAFADLPGWDRDRLSFAVAAFAKSCRRLAGREPDQAIGPNGLGGTPADWAPICALARRIHPPNEPAARKFFETWFQPFAVLGGESSVGLFTGYYEPELDGARRPDQRFRTPLYRRPPDLVTVDLGEFREDLKGRSLNGRVVDGRLRPYPTRQEIDEGALAGQNLELLWVEDPVDAFFLHIQGSGRIRLAEGGALRVGYADNNGWPFYGIARDLIDSGALPPDKASMQSVRTWLRDHPDEATALMQKNRRYIFFRTIEGDAPVGALGTPLTAGRSLAVDPAFIPLGAPLWLETTYPAVARAAGQPLRRLMIAQDVGGGIKGPVRGDFYWGTGEPALAVAGGMMQRGRYFLLLPKSAADRLPATGVDKASAD